MIEEVNSLVIVILCLPLTIKFSMVFKNMKQEMLWQIYDWYESE